LRQDLLLSNNIHTVAYHQHNKTVNPLASYQNVKIGHKELDSVLIMFCKDVCKDFVIDIRDWVTMVTVFMGG